MNTLREAAQQALEALEDLADCGAEAWSEQRPCVQIGREAITALKAALAEPVQEPVAWVLALPDGRLDRLSVVAYDDEAEEMLQRSIAGCTLVPLYPAPPQRKPLTEEAAWELVEQDHRMEEYGETALELIRKVERAHGIGEHR